MVNRFDPRALHRHPDCSADEPHTCSCARPREAECVAEAIARAADNAERRRIFRGRWPDETDERIARNFPDFVIDLAALADDPLLVVHADCVGAMRSMPEASVDAVVTDPPYGLGFMGKEWDTPGSFVERKPARANTFDHVGGNHNPSDQRDAARTAVVEGRRLQEWTEVWAREALRVLKPGGYMLAFGGTRTFHRMTCAVEDAGFVVRDCLSWLYGSGFPKSRTALKPAWEPVVLAQRPVDGTYAANVAKHGVGTLNIDGARIGFGSESDSAAGRWPANVLLDEGAAAMLDAQSGDRPSSGLYARAVAGEMSGAASIPLDSLDNRQYDDAGGASRFFYVAKASRADRRPGNSHPTVKPVELMRHLARLVTPPGGLVLDPFAGSGTTGQAALAEGLRCVLIERDAEYVAGIREWRGAMQMGLGL